MTYLRVITFFLLYFSSVVNANESKIIELHKSKSLDQLVLEKNNNDQDNNDNQERIRLEPNVRFTRVDIPIRHNLY